MKEGSVGLERLGTVALSVQDIGNRFIGAGKSKLPVGVVRIGPGEPLSFGLRLPKGFEGRTIVAAPFGDFAKPCKASALALSS
jgi:hypothetical protein